MHLRRVLFVAVFACLLVLNPVARSDAATKGCDPKCEQLISWYWASSLTLEREWFGYQVVQSPWAQCIFNHESRSAGLYRADNGVGYYGAWQDAPSTWDVGARWADRPDLVGVRPDRAEWFDQAIVNGTLHGRLGGSPWAGDNCG